MRKKLHVIYIPGLGDDKPDGQRRVVSSWRLWGVDSELFQMAWSDRFSWEDKFARLLQRIDQLTKEGKQIGIVGASAGASAAINAYAARKENIVGVVIIAGKVNRPGSVGASYHSKNPSFIESLDACQASLQGLSTEDRRKILSRYSAYDEVVSKHDSIIPGAVNRVRHVPGHVLIIATQILFGAPSFLRFLKKQM